MNKTGSWLLFPVSLTAALILILSSCSGPQMRSDVLENRIPSEIREDLTVSGEIHVLGDVKVFPGTVLTVEPGTRFLFEPFDPDGDGVNDSRLLIEGRLVARGEPDAPIYFTSAAESPEPGDWLELRVDRSEGNVLEYCVVQHSRYGLHVHFSSGVVANSIFRNNIDGTRFGNSRFRFLQNLITENTGKGINLRESRILVTANLLKDNRHGIFLFEGGSEAEILYNRFSGNELSDLRFGDFYKGPLPRTRGNGRDDNRELAVLGPVDTGQIKTNAVPKFSDMGPQLISATVTPRWEKNAGSMVDAGLRSVPGGKRFAVGTWGGELLQLGVADGEVLARTHVGDVIDATPLFLSDPQSTSSGRFFVTAWDRIVRFVDAVTGEVVGELYWEESLADDHRQGTAVSVGDRIYLGLWNGVFAAIDPVKMEWVWQKPLDGAVRAAPAFDSEQFWVGTDGGTLNAISRGGEIVDSIEVGSPVRTTPAVLGSGDVIILTGDGILMRLRGGSIAWKRKLPGVGTYASPLAMGMNTVLAGDGSGALSLYDGEGALLWRTGLGSAVHMIAHGGPVLWAGTEDGRLVAVSPVSGAVLFELKSGMAVHAMPYDVPGDNPGVIWVSRDGIVRAHDLQIKRIPWEGPTQ